MYSVIKTAQLLAVSPSLIRKLIRNRQIAFVRIGRCVRIPQQVIDGLVSSGTMRPTSSAPVAKAPSGGAE